MRVLQRPGLALTTTVVLFSLTATAALMGWIPSSFGRTAGTPSSASTLPVAPALAAQHPKKFAFSVQL